MLTPLNKTPKLPPVSASDLISLQALTKGPNHLSPQHSEEACAPWHHSLLVARDQYLRRSEDGYSLASLGRSREA